VIRTKVYLVLYFGIILVMENDYIDLKEPTPILHSKKCKYIAFGIKLLLQYLSIITAFMAWYLYDYFIAGATLLITFLIVGIVRAKIRNSVIPLHQMEYHYTDKEIANWFTEKEFCSNPVSNELQSHNAIQKGLERK